MPVRSACLAVACVAVAGPALAAGCHVDPFTGQLGSDTSVDMAAKAGQPCTIRMRSGATVGIAIASQAQHGKASVDESRIQYTPARGYTGPDQFVFTRTGEDYESHARYQYSGTSHYTVSVDVSP